MRPKIREYLLNAGRVGLLKKAAKKLAAFWFEQLIEKPIF
jgi:hypothetical protein